jgi:hypothetical protein
VRIHRKKPKALGFKFGCGFTRHLLHQGSPTRDIDLSDVVLLPLKLKQGPGYSIQPRWRGQRSVGEVIE